MACTTDESAFGMTKQPYFLGIMIFLGFASGLPLAITTSALPAWLSVSHVNIETIGMFSLLGLPYTFKFLWSPLIDRFHLGQFGKFRGWVLLTQGALILSFILLGFFNPDRSVKAIALMGILIAFFSATQDLGIDAYRTDFLHAQDRGLGSAIFIGGYRIALMVSGGLSLVFAQYFGWSFTFWLMAALMLVGVFTNMAAPKLSGSAPERTSLWMMMWAAIREFSQRSYALPLLLVVILYKLGSAFVLSLLSTFLLRDLQFSLAMVGGVYKIYGVFAILAGFFLAGILLRKMPLFWALFWFGVLSALTNLTFFLLIFCGKSNAILIVSIVIEQMTSGMSTAAFLAFLMALCHRQFTAIQFSLFSAVDSLGRVFIGPIAAEAQHFWGWVGYFSLGIVLALPALGLLLFLKNKIDFSAEKIC